MSTAALKPATFKSRCCLFQSRAAVHLHIAQAKARHSAGFGHCEMPIQVLAVDVIAGGGQEAGAERGRRRESVIKSQVHGQEHNRTVMNTNNAVDRYPVFPLCALAVQ